MSRPIGPFRHLSARDPKVPGTSDGAAGQAAHPRKSATRAGSQSRSPTKSLPQRRHAPLKLRFARDSPLEESGFEPSVPLGEKRSCQAWTPHAEPARADSDGHCLAARPRWHGSRMVRSNTDSRSARPPNGYSLECPFLEHVDYCLINEILLFPIVRSSDYFLGAGQIHERCSPTFNERDP